MAGPRMGGHGHRGPMMPGEKAKDFKGTMGKLLGYLKKFLPGIVLVLICAAASTIFSIFGPKVLGQATTKLFEGLIAMLTGTGGIDFTALAQILLFLAALYLISALLTYVQGWVMSGVATKLSYNMRKDISEKIDRMPLSYFDRVSNGEVLSRITNDVDTITQTLNQPVADCQQCHHDGRRAVHDAFHQSADDAGGAVHPAAERADCHTGGQAQPAVFP